jgi:23S rRNA (pseudouridine1915-N3)-methyltransferase
MLIRLLAAGTRMPDWVDSGVEDYARRFTGQLKFELKEIPLGTRASPGDTARAMADEGRRMLAAIKPDTFVTTLEVKGKPFTTEQLAAWLKQRLQSGQDLALLIGGPDGLAPECLQRSNHRWSLSPLTLPHALVRIVVAEQLYRAQTILAGHPYHRP